MGELLAQAGSPAALIALGINLFRFEVKGGKLGIIAMSALRLLAMPAAALLLAKLLDLPAASSRRGRAVRGDADRRERVYFCGSVSAAGESGVGRCGAGDAAGGGDVAGRCDDGGGGEVGLLRQPSPQSRQ